MNGDLCQVCQECHTPFWVHRTVKIVVCFRCIEDLVLKEMKERVGEGCER